MNFSELTENIEIFYNICYAIIILMIIGGVYMNKFKHLVFLSMTVVTISLGSTASFASEVVPSQEQTNIEQTQSTEDILAKEVSMFFDEIKGQIIQEYGTIYNLDNFSYEYKIRKENDKNYIDMDIYVDMTLTRHPSESPYVKGMEKALEEVDETKKDLLQNEINSYITRVEDEAYNISDKSVFTYTVSLKNDVETYSLDTNKAPIYYRYNVGDEIFLVEESSLEDVEDASIQQENGYMFAKEELEESGEANFKAAYASFTYDRKVARDWAIKNAHEDPEYPSKDVPGTDCANFVSKALNKGGIPQDKSGKWYGASSWGGWAGDHWFRTGYNGKTGVVIYMTNKGYFNKQTNEAKVAAGSIMYWNNTSHVALVTYGDGSTIKYTQHGATQSANTVYKSPTKPSNVSASFYTPSLSIQ